VLAKGEAAEKLLKTPEEKAGHQIHAAISFCDEHDMHLFLRKCRAAAEAFGDAGDRPPLFN
jgi:hypothetical protein